MVNKQQFGYKVGKLYLKFKQWQHPTLLKWLYIFLLTSLIFFVFSDFFIYLLIFILFIVALALYSDLVWGPTPAEQQIINELKEIKELQKEKRDKEKDRH